MRLNDANVHSHRDDSLLSNLVIVLFILHVSHPLLLKLGWEMSLERDGQRWHGNVLSIGQSPAQCNRTFAEEQRP